MKDLRPVTHYFRLYIIGDVTISTIFLSQKTYIQKILEHFGMQNFKAVDTFIVKNNISIYANPCY